MKNIFYLILFLSLSLISCKNRSQSSTEAVTQGLVPVKVTHIGIHNISDAIDLNATSVFMLKTFVRSTTNGYLKEVCVQPGDRIVKGHKMFIIKSKEAENIGDKVVALDSSFHFTGLITIYSPAEGFVTQLNYREGDYVQEGETIAAISDASSLVFMLELPYELKSFLPDNRKVTIVLPDGQNIIGSVDTPMPAVDPASQTLNYKIRVSGNKDIPENLVARVHFIRTKKNMVVCLPREAVLTNEVQNDFWIMKMIDSITAVKVPVLKGIENNDSVEIVSPVLSPSDLILIKGNYGLPDSAKVRIEE